MHIAFQIDYLAHTEIIHAVANVCYIQVIAVRRMHVPGTTANSSLHMKMLITVFVTSVWHM